MPRANFLKLRVSATDNFTGSPIPATNLTIGLTSYGRADGSGDIYIQGADNAWYDGTVYADQTRYSNYTYAMTPASAYLQITRGTNNLAGQTNTVIVGEQVALTCQFVDPATGLPSSIAPITNFQWTVPGSIFSGYEPSTTLGKVYHLTNVADFTNSSITFYWKDGSGGATLEVQCSAIAKGVTLTAKSFFQVTRPAPALNVTIDGTVAADTNYNRPGIWLHFGTGKTNQTGIRFQYDPDPSFTHTNYFFIQLGSIRREEWWNSGTNWVGIAAGLDNGAVPSSYKYPVTPILGPRTAGDAPAHALLTKFDYVSANDDFTMWLMFQPNLSGALPVGLKKVDWHWDGSAENFFGAWALMTGQPPTNVTVSTIVGHPEWTTNMLLLNWTHTP